jgi:hypothetical protein
MGNIRGLEPVNKRMFLAWQQIGSTSRHHVHILDGGTDGHRCVVGLRRPVPPGPVRKAGTEHPSLLKLHRCDHRISESNNAAISRIRSAVHGFPDPKSLITMMVLSRAGIAAPQLLGKIAS